MLGFLCNMIIKMVIWFFEEFLEILIFKENILNYIYVISVLVERFVKGSGSLVVYIIKFF